MKRILSNLAVVATGAALLAAPAFAAPCWVDFGAGDGLRERSAAAAARSDFSLASQSR